MRSFFDIINEPLTNERTYRSGIGMHDQRMIILVQAGYFPRCFVFGHNAEDDLLCKFFKTVIGIFRKQDPDLFLM